MHNEILYLDEFKTKLLERKSHNTVKAYISDIERFSDYLLLNHGIRITDISTMHIKRYIEELLMNKKPVTINRKLMSIKRFIDFVNTLSPDDQIKIDIGFLKVQKKTYLDDLLTKNEYDRMLNKAIEKNDTKSAMIFKTLYLTGVRVSELLQIRPEHIYDDNLKVCGKGDKYREIILSEDISSSLSEYIKTNKIPKNSKIFKINRQTVHYRIKRYAGKCRIKLTHAHAHNFRHLCALRLIEEGASLVEVANILGHNDINTTAIYTKKTKNELKNLLNKL